MKYKVNEIFYSIQGEGYFTGQASIFIRLAGCNLKCSWCDTNFKNFKEISILDIYKKIKDYKAKHIVITGGEPSIYDLRELLMFLNSKGYFIQIETNGTNEIYNNINNLWITCSPKKENNYNYILANEIKLVFDNDFNLNILEKFRDIKIKYLQKEFNFNKDYDIIINIIKEFPEWRLSLQTQKLINIQ